MRMIDLDAEFLEEAALLEEEDVHFRCRGIYYPSELVFPCPRNHVLRYLYPDKHFTDFETLRRFEQGRLLEGWFIDRLRQSRRWRVLGTQETVGHVGHGRVIFMGRRDARAYNIALDQIFSIEVKKAGLNWNYYPKDEHFSQANFYLKDGFRGLLVYVNPFLEVRAFPHDFDPELFDRLLFRGYECDGHLGRGTLPPKEPHHWNHQICLYCLYREECGK